MDYSILIAGFVGPPRDITVSRGPMVSISIDADYSTNNYEVVSSHTVSSREFREWYLRERASGINWTDSLPVCPLQLEIQKGDTVPQNPDPDVWLSPQEPHIKEYHPGAEWEIRSKRTKDGHGQQGCYSPDTNTNDKGGSEFFNLIIYDKENVEETIGAGTPDKGGGPGLSLTRTGSVEPPTRGGLLSVVHNYFYSKRLEIALLQDLTESSINTLNHFIKDVIAFNWAYDLDKRDGGYEYRKMYNEVRPPNTGK